MTARTRTPAPVDGICDHYDGRPLAIELPIPPRELSPNARVDRRAKAALVKQYRADAALVTAARVRAQGWQAPSLARVDITYYLGDRRLGQWRPRDVDNALGALKAGLDGIRDGGAIVDDSGRHLALGSVTIRDQGPAGVLIVVSAATG